MRQFQQAIDFDDPGTRRVGQSLYSQLHTVNSPAKETESLLLLLDMRNYTRPVALNVFFSGQVYKLHGDNTTRKDVLIIAFADIPNRKLMHGLHDGGQSFS